MPVRKIIRPGTTLLVAASDASDKVKGLADYVCDGTADEVEIVAALAALPAAGGRVSLSEGIFTISSTITLPDTPLSLDGTGCESATEDDIATRLNFTFGAGANCIVFSATNTGQRISGFGMYGDDTNTQQAINMPDGSAFKQAVDINIVQMATYGMYVSGSQHWIERVYVRDADAGCQAFRVYAPATCLVHCQATRSAGSGVGGLRAFTIRGSGIHLIGCIAERHLRAFEFVDYAHGCTMIGCHGEENQPHILIDGATNAPTGIQVVGGIFNAAQDGGTSAIYVNRAQGIAISGLSMAGSVSNQAIEVTANSYDVHISGCWTDDTTPLVDGGATRLVVDAFYPFVGKNKGTDSIANSSTSKQVAHGLSVTPTVDDFTITLAENPTNTPGAIWVDSIGAANFTVNCENDPGVSNLDFGWCVRVY